MTAERFARNMRWMREGEEFLADRIRAAYAAGLDGDSLLSGWDRAHVVAHLAGNADALGNLLHWARTGVETPMYASPRARAADIEERAALPHAEIHKAALEAAGQLARAIAELPEAAWAAPVRSAQGRAITAAEVPWMRTREVWIHAVDLDAGAGFADLPADLIDALLGEVTTTLGTREGVRPAVLAPADRDRTWTIAGGGTPPIARPAADLLAWAVGRAPDPDLPAPPRWL